MVETGINSGNFYTSNLAPITLVGHSQSTVEGLESSSGGTYTPPEAADHEDAMKEYPTE